MTVPKTSVDENNLMSSRENEVGRAWKRTRMQSITESHPIDKLSHRHFRTCVATSDAGHSCTTFGDIKGVGHRNTFTACSIEAFCWLEWDYCWMVTHCVAVGRR